MDPQTTINPYRRAAYLAWQRLCWDLQPQSWRSRSKLKALRGSQSGKKGLILCNGPSLNKVNFESLTGQQKSLHVLGLNKINLLFERTPFRPDGIVCVNPHVLDQNKKFYNESNIPLFLDHHCTGSIAMRGNVHFLHSTRTAQFARDVSVSVEQGFTVTYVAMQVMFHLGVRDVALVGCDHSFATKGPANAVVTGSENDANHFDSRYFSSGMKWELPDLAGSEYFYSHAGEVFRANQGSITNCTDGGLLEIFPRKSLADWLSG